VVNNVLTLTAVPHILGEGGANDYGALGMGRSKGTMPIQLAGNIKHGGLFETAFGITLGELINDIGGGTLSGRPVKAVQVGGPLGAYIHPDQFDIKFDYEEYTAAAESCGKCTPCRIGAVRGVEVIDRIRAARGSSDNVIARKRDVVELQPVMHNAPKDNGRLPEQEIALLTDLCETMKFGSLCALGGFTPYPVMSALRNWPEDFVRGDGRVVDLVLDKAGA
jgi:formate dehydrogenase iron-sulfur subunit